MTRVRRSRLSFRFGLTLVLSVLLPTLWQEPAQAHAVHTADAALRACDRLALGANCMFEGAHDAPASLSIYRGSCRLISDTLICVRNQPIEHATTTKNATNAAISSTVRTDLPTRGEASSGTLKPPVQVFWLAVGVVVTLLAWFVLRGIGSRMHSDG